MNRSDLVIFGTLFGVLVGVAGFVGVQIVRAPRRATAAAAASAAPEQKDLSSVSKRSLPPPPPKNYEQIAQLLVDAKSSTYMDYILVERDGHVARWVERKSDPITVWIQPTSTIRDFWPDFKDRTKDAFYTWAAAGVPLRFLFVPDSDSASVHVVWVDRFDDSAAGKTYWERDKNWWIVGANIEIAVHRPTGEAYDQQMIRTIALHEVGHLIGLDHSPNIDDIMAPKVHVSALSAADLRTAALIYQLPPGAVKKPPSSP